MREQSCGLDPTYFAHVIVEVEGPGNGISHYKLQGEKEGKGVDCCAHGVYTCASENLLIPGRPRAPEWRA